MNLGYSTKRDPNMEFVAKLLAQADDKSQSQLAKLRMAGIYIEDWEVLKEFENGLKIMAFDSEGLTDIEEGFIRPKERVYRVYGSEEPEIEHKNFRIVAKCPYGLYEIIRDIPLYWSDAVRKDDAGNDVNTCQHRVMFISEDGNIILNEAMYDCSEGQFATNKDWYYDAMKRMREPIIEHIIKHGPDYEMVSEATNRKRLSHDDYDWHNTSMYTYLECENIGKYQVVYMGKRNLCSFVLFDLETGKCLSSGNCKRIFEIGYRLCLPDSEDNTKVICLDRQTGVLTRIGFDTSVFDCISMDNNTTEECKKLEDARLKKLKAISGIVMLL